MVISVIPNHKKYITHEKPWKANVLSLKNYATDNNYGWNLIGEQIHLLQYGFIKYHEIHSEEKY